jgi:penicillin-binding protein 1A
LMLRTGVDSVRQLAQQMGMEGDVPNVPAISLGAVDASLWEMISVYSTFANNGKRPEMHYLTRIETANGEVIANFEAPNPEEFEELFPDSIAQMMTKMLQSVVDSGTARRLRYRYGLYNDIAGKTGTTQGHSDGWFMGYTPNIVAGVWVGGTSPQIRFKSMKLGQGANTALPIWGRFMKKVYKDANFKKWKKQQFEPMDSTVIWEMDCPPFLEDRSMIPGLYEEEDDGGIFDWFENVFEKDKEKARREQVRQRNGPQSEWSREIKERNRKTLKKQKKQKKILEKIFGKGN